MLQQVSEKLLGQFVESLEAELAAKSPAAEGDSAGTPSDEEPIPAWPANPVPGTRRAPDEPEPIDLLELAGGGQLKKYGAAALAVVAVLALLWVLRRRR
jgi:uncharacterized protein (TIGR03382 family)